ncbi:hypothetical protein PI124_g5831 [Phytophthora idaei]|nr:hypothetical protein PI126_g15994 [Phytophthora idaei]KAG3249516.1 hypothetical protein PI124_g5831 [Phytophthora idaei]
MLFVIVVSENHRRSRVGAVNVARIEASNLSLQLHIIYREPINTTATSQFRDVSSLEFVNKPIDTKFHFYRKESS